MSLLTDKEMDKEVRNYKHPKHDEIKNLCAMNLIGEFVNQRGELTYCNYKDRAKNDTSGIRVTLIRV